MNITLYSHIALSSHSGIPFAVRRCRREIVLPFPTPIEPQWHGYRGRINLEGQRRVLQERTIVGAGRGVRDLSETCRRIPCGVRTRRGHHELPEFAIFRFAVIAEYFFIECRGEKIGSGPAVIVGRALVGG